MWLYLTTPPTGDLAHNPGMCPDWELNLRSFGLQALDQSTEPHQPACETEFFQVTTVHHLAKAGSCVQAGG